jgi:GH24 family phage-related lysozyme (muramidase)
LKNYIKLPAENKIVLKDERGEAGVEISLLPISKGSLNDLERYLRFGGKKPDDGGYTPPEGAVDVSRLSLSADGIDFLKKQEAVITHVYNDAKGGKSTYCDEHSSHSNSSWYCTKTNHFGKDKDGKSILGKPTIGLGHLITSESELEEYCNKTVTKDEMIALFKNIDLPKYEAPLKAAIDEPITQAQYDALLSFVFNTGPKDLRKRQVFKNINTKNTKPQDMKDAFMQWKTPSIVIPRREDEIVLFNTGKYTFRGN